MRLEAELKSVLIIIIIMSFFYCHHCAVHPCTSHLNATFYHVAGFSSTLDVYPLQMVLPSLVVPSAIVRKYNELKSGGVKTTHQPDPLNTDTGATSGTGSRVLAPRHLRIRRGIPSHDQNLIARQPVACYTGAGGSNATGVAPVVANSALLQDPEVDEANSITFHMDRTDMETGTANVTEAPVVANSALLQDQESVSDDSNFIAHHLDSLETGISNVTEASIIANSALLPSEGAITVEPNAVTLHTDPVHTETGIVNVTEASVVANSASLQDQEAISDEPNAVTIHMDPVDMETGIVNVTDYIKCENQEPETLAHDPLSFETEPTASTSTAVASVPKVMQKNGRVVYDYSHQEPKSPLKDPLADDDDDYPSSWTSTTPNVGSPPIHDNVASPPIREKETQVVEITAQKYYFEKIKVEPETPPKKKPVQKRRKAAAKSKRKGAGRKRNASGTPAWLARLLRTPVPAKGKVREMPTRGAKMRQNERYVDENDGDGMQTPKRSPVTKPPKKTKRFRELFKQKATPSPPKLSPQGKIKKETPDSPELEQDRGPLPMSQDPLTMDGQEYVLRKILRNKKF